MLGGRPTPAVAGAFFAGALVGASLTAVLLAVAAGLLSPLPIGVRAVLALVAMGALAARSAGWWKVKLPENRRQIPEWVFARRPARAAFGFAFELGTGLRTYIPSNAAYVAAVAAVMFLPQGWVAILAVACLAFGWAAGRSLVVVFQLGQRRPVTRPSRWSLLAASLATFGIGIALAAANLV